MKEETEEKIVTTDRGGGEMTDNSRPDLKEVLKVYYGEPDLTPEESKEVEQMISEVKASGFLEKCHEICKKKEKKYWYIGKMAVNKAACLIGAVCCILLLCGFTVYSVYIKNLHMENKGDHEEIGYTLDKNADVKSPKRIEVYYDPAWIPEGYHLESVNKQEKEYTIIFSSDSEEDDFNIYYIQSLPGLKHHLSTENGNHEAVSFGRYYGKYVDTDDSNFLIVTDGIYVYILISDENINKEDLIRMLY